jgi:hypothetical protein
MNYELKTLKFYILSKIRNYQSLKEENEYSPYLDVYYDMLNQINQIGGFDDEE